MYYFVEKAFIFTPTVCPVKKALVCKRPTSVVLDKLCPICPTMVNITLSRRQTVLVSVTPSDLLIVNMALMFCLGNKVFVNLRVDV